MIKRKRSKKLDIAKKMPPLRHSIPEQDFDWKTSEVMKWLLLQDEIRSWIWQQITNSKYIIFDPETRTWCGVEYSEGRHDDGK